MSGVCFRALDSSIHRFYLDLSIKGPGALKERPHELLWTLCSKYISVVCTTYVCRKQIATAVTF